MANSATFGWPRVGITTTGRTIGHGKQADPPAWLDYNLWQGPAPEQPFRDNVVHYNWHFFWHWGNGEVGNNGVHTVDLCRWALGVGLSHARDRRRRSL